MSPLFYLTIMKEAESKIRELIEPRLKEEDLFLVDVRILPGSKIQVFLDSDDNITINQCAAISRYLESFLDQGGIVPTNYLLEVSSPGMSSPLKVLRQYKKRMGRTLEVTKNDGSKVVGILRSYDESGITLEEELAPMSKKSQKTTPVQEPKKMELLFKDIKSVFVQFKFK